MKLIIFLSVLIARVWSQEEATDPPHPEFSPTCFFRYNTSTMGDPSAPKQLGYFGIKYAEDETKRMQVFNVSEIYNGTKRRHDYSLDRMDMGVEYYMNWTRGKPTDCEQYNEPYVINVWEGLDEYVYNGTKTIMGKKMNIWKYVVGEGEMILIGVSVDNNRVPLMYAQVIKQRRRVITTHYTIKDFTENPDPSIFDIPKICQQRSANSNGDASRLKRRFSPFS